MRSEGLRRHIEIHALARASAYDIDRFALGAALREPEPAAAEKLSAFVQPHKAVQRAVVGIGRINGFPYDGTVRDHSGFDLALRPKRALAVLVEGDRPPFASEFTPFPLRIKNIGNLAPHITMFHVGARVRRVGRLTITESLRSKHSLTQQGLPLRWGREVFPNVDWTELNCRIYITYAYIHAISYAKANDNST